MDGRADYRCLEEDLKQYLQSKDKKPIELRMEHDPSSFYAKIGEAKESRPYGSFATQLWRFLTVYFIDSVILSNYTFAMINRFCKRAAALVLALIGMAAACGCAKRAKADATFVMLTAPTVEPIVTPVPTPESTPPPKKTPQAEKTPEDNKKEDEAKEKEKEKEKPKSTADQKEEKKASAKTPHAKDYTKVDIKKASGTKVTDFETDRIDGGKLSQSYFSGGTITLVNVWSTT